ncbi:hypothetical protein [Kushneria phosphatilytica]|uniref:Uncharacterized protein n=1 Tax=Kushneria phosphatilytica TaxID=657387 RepID=A0A1S1NUT3_9GAMM|nr:hypothetical protein [Kushneria phosphatilytica]OHV07517.1 hypothetical protein BH688_14900 [Kushneria phosphatilytica]QEL10000.1 hypothetical protein FY550_01855 [Kushneria phosphatilytica]
MEAFNTSSCETLRQTLSLERVAEIINQGGTPTHEPYEVAAHFAYEASLAAGHLSESRLTEQLTTLADLGADFDQPAALRAAKAIAMHKLNI